MVRKYIRKRAPPPYSPEDLMNAVKAVQNGVLTTYRAAKLYNIPKATIYKHVKGQRGIKSKSLGRPTALSFKDEKKIADGLKAMEKWGFGLSKKEVLETIGLYVRENSIDTPFKNGVPGDDFFIRFRKTHNLSLRKPQAVEAARKKSIDPFIIHEYFILLKEVTTDISATEIWNLDETSFCMDPTRVKVLGPIGMPCHRVTSGPGKENITVLFAANAAGEKLPPLIVFKGKNVWDSWMAPTSTGFDDITYAATKNGWMEAEVFTNYFTRNFLRNIHSKRPAVLIYDGHASHVGLPLVQKARDEGIIILKLPPHTSHILQPLDLSVFRPMKIKWDEELVKWQRKNYGKRLPKSDFSTIIATIWKNLKPEVIKKGFEKGGIFPFSDKVIPPEKFEPEAYQRWLSSFKNDNIVPATSTTSSLEKETVEPITSVQTESAINILPSTSSASLSLNLVSPGTSFLLQKDPPSSQKKSFDEFLLEKVKQIPNIKTGRKRVCTGAEIITSVEGMEKIATKIKEKEDSTKSKTKQKKSSIPAAVESDDDDEIIQDESDEYDICDELEEKEEEDHFMELMNANFKTLNVNDWIIVKLSSKKATKMYVAQITEKEPCFCVKFTRRIGSSSSFHWPNVEDTSIIDPNEVYKVLPSPIIDKRGRITFSVCFDSYNLC